MPGSTQRTKRARAWQQRESAGVEASRLLREVLDSCPVGAEPARMGEWLMTADRILEVLPGLSIAWSRVWRELRAELTVSDSGPPVIDLRLDESRLD